MKGKGLIMKALQETSSAILYYRNSLWKNEKIALKKRISTNTNLLKK